MSDDERPSPFDIIRWSFNRPGSKEQQAALEKEVNASSAISFMIFSVAKGASELSLMSVGKEKKANTFNLQHTVAAL